MPPERLQESGSDDKDVEIEDDTFKKPISKGGRKPDPVRSHFTATGDRSSSCKRAPVKCNFCDKHFTASQAEISALRSHLTFACKKCPQEVRQQVLKRAAEHIDLAAAEDAEAAGGAQRKRQKLNSSSSSSTQRQIGVYLAGSAQNQLGPAQLKAAIQHFLRFIVCNNIPFRVSSSQVSSRHVACLEPASVDLLTLCDEPCIT